VLTNFGVVSETDRNGTRRTSGSVVRVHALLDLRRTCADLKLTFSRSSAREKCLRR
jgi:hypothetical protein